MHYYDSVNGFAASTPCVDSEERQAVQPRHKRNIYTAFAACIVFVHALELRDKPFGKLRVLADEQMTIRSEATYRHWTAPDGPINMCIDIPYSVMR